jgi:hypothetical protein
MTRKCLAAGPCNPKESGRAWRYAILSYPNQAREPLDRSEGFCLNGEMTTATGQMTTAQKKG